MTALRKDRPQIADVIAGRFAPLIDNTVRVGEIEVSVGWALLDADGTFMGATADTPGSWECAFLDVPGPDGEPVDIVALPTAGNGRWWLRHASTAILGWPALNWARLRGLPLCIVEDPRKWVDIQGRGVCILDWNTIHLVGAFEGISELRFRTNALRQRFERRHAQEVSPAWDMSSPQGS